MHSKWQLWDFFRSFPRDSWQTLSGKVILQAFDPLSLRMMKDHLIKGLSQEQRPLQISGAEAHVEWLQENFMSLSLFGSQESWIINSPDEMPQQAKDYLGQEDFEVTGRVLALAFSHESAFAKRALKWSGVSHLQIEAPRFWETAKLVDFLCVYFNLPLDANSKQYLLVAVENEFMPLFDAFRLLKLNFPSAKSLALADVQALVGVERLDNFSLAQDMGKKAWKPFFERLLSVEMDFDRLLGLFYFLQSHLVKLADPGYAQGKARLTKYDQEILTLSKNWTASEVQHLLKCLQIWIKLCRSKDELLLTNLRQNYLKSLEGAFSPFATLA